MGPDVSAWICPWDGETRLSGAPRNCPRCGRPLHRPDGARLRRLDILAERLRPRLEQYFERLLEAGGACAAGVFIVAPVLHLAVSPLIAGPSFLIAHMIACRVLFVAPVRRLLSGRRRFLVRWIPRMAFLWLGGIGYTVTAVPVVGALAGLASFIGLSFLAYHYSLRCLARELEGAAPEWWETALVVTLLLVTAGLVLVGLLLGLLVGWSIGELLATGS